MREGIKGTGCLDQVAIDEFMQLLRNKLNWFENQPLGENSLFLQLSVNTWRPVLNLGYIQSHKIHIWYTAGQIAIKLLYY